MKRFLSILLVCLALLAACTMSVSAADGFNSGAVQECIFLNDTGHNFGHCAMILVDANNIGRFYSFQTGGLWKTTFSVAQLNQFMKDGIIPNVISDFQFDRAIRFGITAEEGQRMYDYAETHKFRNFYMYASFFTSFLPIFGDNCLSFVHSVFKAGSSKYNYLYPFGLPNVTFYTIRLRLKMSGVAYTLAYPG